MAITGRRDVGGGISSVLKQCFGDGTENWPFCAHMHERQLAHSCYHTPSPSACHFCHSVWFQTDIYCPPIPSYRYGMMSACAVRAMPSMCMWELGFLLTRMYLPPSSLHQSVPLRQSKPAGCCKMLAAVVDIRAHAASTSASSRETSVCVTRL
jgi:hypothetical protein